MIKYGARYKVKYGGKIDHSVGTSGDLISVLKKIKDDSPIITGDFVKVYREDRPYCSFKLYRVNGIFENIVLNDCCPNCGSHRWQRNDLKAFETVTEKGRFFTKKVERLVPFKSYMYCNHCQHSLEIPVKDSTEE